MRVGVANAISSVNGWCYHQEMKGWVTHETDEGVTHETGEGLTHETDKGRVVSFGKVYW